MIFMYHRTMEELLPPFLRHENISRLDDDVLFITDRRFLPFEKKEVACHDYHDAASAIKDMVTQGGGPLEVALNAFILTSRQGGNLGDAVRVLSSARPTNTTMKRTLEALLEEVRNGRDPENAAMEAFSYYDGLYDSVSDIGEKLIADGDGIMTRCFPEHTFMLSCAKAVRNGKDITVYVPETRPYLQGSRLTEPCLRAMGIRCMIIADAMNASVMSQGLVQKVMTASDLALSDRTVVNKAGTLSDAIVAAYYGIPYYAFSLSIDKTIDYSDIVIEYRSKDEMRNARGMKTAEDSADALYPCFDIIPSSLVKGIITKEGVL